MKQSITVASLAEQVYEALKTDIVTGRIKPGQRIDPQYLARDYGVSRTPVRDAIGLLQRDRLVDTHARSGTFVTVPTSRDVQEINELREAIEGRAARVAARRMPKDTITALRNSIRRAAKRAESGDFLPFYSSDSEFHREIVAATGNSRMIEIRETLEPYIELMRSIRTVHVDHIAQSTNLHLQILDAIEARDPDAAELASDQHLSDISRWSADEVTMD